MCMYICKCVSVHICIPLCMYAQNERKSEREGGEKEGVSVEESERRRKKGADEHKHSCLSSDLHALLYAKIRRFAESKQLLVFQDREWEYYILLIYY